MLIVFSDSVSLPYRPLIVGSQARILVDVLCRHAINGGCPERTGVTFKILGLKDVLIFGDYVLWNRLQNEIVDKNLAGIFGRHRAWPR